MMLPEANNKVHMQANHNRSSHSSLCREDESFRAQHLCHEAHSLLETAPDCWPWHLVAGESLVDVDKDAGIGLLVKRSAFAAVGAAFARVLTARAGDLDVDALWVVLGAVA